VKDTLYAVISIFFKTALFFLCIMLVIIFSPYARLEGELPSVEYFLYRISGQGAEVFFGALFLALVSANFRIVRKPGKKTLTFFLVFVSAFCILYAGLYGFGVFFPEQDGESAWAGMSVPLRADMVERADGAFVWIGSGEGEETPGAGTSPVVVMNPKEGAGNFRVYSGFRFDAKAGTLRLSPGDGEISLAAEASGDAGVSPFLRFFADDLAYIADRIKPKALVDIPALCSVFSLVFFGFSLWALAKLSRWPLFNLWFTLAAAWLVFSGARFLGLYLVPELLMFESLAGAARYLPEAFPGFCGLILFLAGLLGTPLKAWKREMRYE
jgi:uncharacterized membrane protein